MTDHSGCKLGLGREWSRAVVSATGVAGLMAISILNVPPIHAQVQGSAASLPEFDVASVKVFRRGSAPENRQISAAHGVLTVRQHTLRGCIE